MKQEQHSLPLRRTSEGEQIDTRPLYIEEWLDGLPYIDFKKTSRLLYEATQATNQQPIKPATRLELVTLYNRPYQYYLDSQIKTGAQHTLQSIDNMQQQIEILKLIAVNLSFACKLAVEETLKRKTLWGQSKPPLNEMLMSLTYLSHALIFSFLEYAPTPKNVWRELNFIYDFAESIKQENSTLNLQDKTTTIAKAYNRIALASLADPYHLPFGAIWEIYEQLGSWTEHARIKKFERAASLEGYFVANLDSDSPPVSLTKFDTSQAGDRHRLIDTAILGKILQTHLAQINAGESLDEEMVLSPYYAKSILSHTIKAWGLPPVRDLPRQSGKGALHLTCGVNAAYYFLNNEEEFSSPVSVNAEDLDSAVDSGTTPRVNYKVDSWNLVDVGPGGFAVIKNDKPQYSVRVGDLVAMGRSNTENQKPVSWTLGVIRWLMVRKSKVYKIGIQTLSEHAQTGTIRARRGSEQDSRFRRAFIISDPNQPGENAVITSKGLFIEQRELELNFAMETSQIVAKGLLESSVAFEYFKISKK